MSTASVDPSISTSSRRRASIELLVVFFLAAAWMFVLATWTGFRIGRPVHTRDNLVFDLDVPTVARTLLNEADPKFKSRHRLARPIWGPVGATLKTVLSRVVDTEQARSIATRLMMAVAGGIGFASLWFVAQRQRLTLSIRLLLFVMFAVFSTQILCSVPEFYGISASLLSLTFAVYCSNLRLPWKAAALAALTLIGAGTTTTVGAVPAACLALSVLFAYLPPDRARKWVVVATIAGTCLATLAVGALAMGPYRKAIRETAAGKGVGIGSHYRILCNPELTPGFALRGLIHPAVGTNPEIEEGPTNRPTFNRSIWNQTDRIALAGQLAWLVLLVWGTVSSLRNGLQHFEAMLLVGWIAANLALHNIWGNEFFLYSPHWAWALFGLVILGAQRIPTVALWITGLLVIAGGISELLMIEQLFRVLS